MSSGKVKCTCGWSWNKSDSSKKDMYICHECGRDNSNNMKNGGWLDNYTDGGTMQEHQENYNDSKTSVPEGFVGEGYNTKGRNYSPAWGGQFEDGGEIPNAQKGKKVKYVKSKNDPRYKAYQDSLSLYKSTPIRVAELKKINKKIVDDLAKKTNKVLKSEMVKVGNEPFNKNRNRGYYQDDNKMILGHDSSIKPISFDKYQMKKLDGSGVFKYFDGNNIQTDDFGVYKKPQQQVIVKPKSKPKPKQEVVQPDLPRVEAINLPPMQQLQSINPPAISDVVREPKSYNVNKKTYNEKGELIDYYTKDEEGVDYERAMLIKSGADAWNRDILKRYGPQNEYRTPKSAADAAERLKQLRSEFEMTPNYQMGGSVYPVNYVPEAQMGRSIGPTPIMPLTNFLAEKISGWFGDDEQPVKKPVAKSKARTLNIVDPRKKMATTNQPLRPNSDLVGGKYSSKHLDKLMQEAKRQGLSKQDMMNLSAMGFQETKWGRSDGNIGHVLHTMDNPGSSDDYVDFVDAYKSKMKLADRLKIKDPALRLQVYNGLGTITPKTEKDYHGFEMQKIYGVPIPKGGINMRKNPLYGKQVMDIRDNVLAKNPEYLQYMDSIYKAPVPGYMQDVRMNKQKPPRFIIPPLGKKEMGGSIPGAVGFSYARTQSPAPDNGPYAKKTLASAKDGEIIKDDMGQWAHPGEITEIDSPYITMQGVPYPVLGISDTGDMQMMYPEEDYEFDGESVTEYPMAKNGIRQEQKGLVNLDQLTNFTNYNTKQPGGWLDKY